MGPPNWSYELASDPGEGCMGYRSDAQPAADTDLKSLTASLTPGIVCRGVVIWPSARWKLIRHFEGSPEGASSRHQTVASIQLQFKVALAYISSKSASPSRVSYARLVGDLSPPRGSSRSLPPKTPGRSSRFCNSMGK